jgi:hypothetical protein
MDEECNDEGHNASLSTTEMVAWAFSQAGIELYQPMPISPEMLGLSKVTGGQGPRPLAAEGTDAKAWAEAGQHYDIFTDMRGGNDESAQTPLSQSHW